jgi:hypothetical protein
MGSLILGFVLVVSSVILFLIVYRISQSNVTAGCFSDGWVANFHVPLMVCMFTFGFGFLTKFALAALV